MISPNSDTTLTPATTTSSTHICIMKGIVTPAVVVVVVVVIVTLLWLLDPIEPSSLPVVVVWYHLTRKS